MCQENAMCSLGTFGVLIKPQSDLPGISAGGAKVKIPRYAKVEPRIITQKTHAVTLTRNSHGVATE